MEGLEACRAALHMPEGAPPQRLLGEPMGTVWADDCDQRAINSKLGQACCQLINCVAPPYYLIQASSVHAGLASIDLLWSSSAGICQLLRQASVGYPNKSVQVFLSSQATCCAAHHLSCSCHCCRHKNALAFQTCAGTQPADTINKQLSKM